MAEHLKTLQAAHAWFQDNADRTQAAAEPADLRKLTEELNAHLQAAGVVPVTLPCGCCVLLGLELHPDPTPFGLFFDVKPIRRPAGRNLH